MEEQLIALLLADAAVTALVVDRIRFVVASAGEAYPFIVLTKVSDVDANTYRKLAVLSEARIQVDCYGTSYGSAKLLARAVKQALNGAGQGQAGVIDRIFFETERDGFEADPSPDESFRVSSDYRVFHR